MEAWDAGHPWWNQQAIDYLASQLPAGGTVFEWGAGGSTVWLAARGLAVITVESDSMWAAAVRERCPGVCVWYEPDQDRHYQVILDLPPDSLDVVIIDGPVARAACARAAAGRVKPGGLVVLDDTNVDYYAAAGAAFAGWDAVTFTGPKAGCDGDWSTTFYRKECNDPPPVA